MANDSRIICSMCLRRIPPNACTLKCDCCQAFVHKNCTNFLKTELDDIIQSKRPWSCLTCNESNFAFNHLLDERDFLSSFSLRNINIVSIDNISDKIFSPYDLDDEKIAYAEHDNDINPDIHYFGQQPELSNLDSKYYLEDEFVKYVSELRGREMQSI